MKKMFCFDINLFQFYEKKKLCLCTDAVLKKSFSTNFGVR